MLSPGLPPLLLQWRSPARGWLAALMLFLLALAAEMELAGLLQTRPFLLFLPAVLLATALGGLAPAAAVAVAASVTAWLLFLRAEGGGSVVSAWLSVAEFLLLSAGGVALVEGMLQLAAALARERARTARLVEGQRMMLHELQHRMANHLQFVSGVLALQARGIEDPASAKAALNDATQRLEMLGRIHRRLCEPAPETGGFAALVQEISQDLLTAAGAENIVCVVDVAPVELEPDRMTSLALIITELLTNALKHAFADGRSGKVSIVLDRPDPGRYALEVRDNGVGMAPGLRMPEMPANGGLGARILRALADRLEGQLSYHQESGTVARLEFPAPA